MGARKATAVFFACLIVAFFTVAVLTIYGFDYFEDALGGRRDNLLLSLVSYTAVAVVITVGFATVLLRRRSDIKSFQVLGLFIAAVLACGPVHAFAVAGPLLDRFASWELRLGLFALYSALLGAVIAAGLIRFTRSGRYAA